MGSARSVRPLQGISAGSLLLLALFLVLPVPPLSDHAGGSGIGVYPPPLTGDWNVTSPTQVNDEIIALNGSLRISSVLTMQNVSLQFAALTPGAIGLRLEPGGSLVLRNVTISPTTPGTGYTFELYSTFDFADVTIDGPSGTGSLSCGGPRIFGVPLAYITNLTISDSGGRGLDIASSSLQVEGLEISGSACNALSATSSVIAGTDWSLSAPQVIDFGDGIPLVELRDSALAIAQMALRGDGSAEAIAIDAVRTQLKVGELSVERSWDVAIRLEDDSDLAVDLLAIVDIGARGVDVSESSLWVGNGSIDGGDSPGSVALFGNSSTLEVHNATIRGTEGGFDLHSSTLTLGTTNIDVLGKGVVVASSTTTMGGATIDAGTPLSLVAGGSGGLSNTTLRSRGSVALEASEVAITIVSSRLDGNGTVAGAGSLHATSSGVSLTNSTWEALQAVDSLVEVTEGTLEDGAELKEVVAVSAFDGAEVRLLDCPATGRTLLASDPGSIIEERFSINASVRQPGGAPAVGALVEVRALDGKRVDLQTASDIGTTQPVPILVRSVNETQSVLLSPLVVEAILGPLGDQTSLTPAGPTAVHLEIHDRVGPDLTITAPAEGTVTNEATILIAGVATDDIGVSAVEVSSDGLNWTSADGTSSWQATVPLAPGENLLKARALDTSGNVGVTQVSVIQDLLPPVPLWFEPLDGELRNSIFVDVVIQTGPSDRVMLQGVAVANLAGWANTTLRLDIGVNILHLHVSDPAGNVAASERTITVDIIPPFLEITSPHMGEWRNTTTVMIEGRAEKGATLSVADRDVPHPQEAFFIPVQLSEGDQVVEVVVTDTAGNTNRTFVAVRVDTVPPTLSVSLTGNKGPLRQFNGTAIGAAHVWMEAQEVSLQADGGFVAERQQVNASEAITFVATDAAGNRVAVSVPVGGLPPLRPFDAAHRGEEGLQVLIALAIGAIAGTTALALHLRRTLIRQQRGDLDEIASIVATRAEERQRALAAAALVDTTDPLAIIDKEDLPHPTPRGVTRTHESARPPDDAELPRDLQVLVGKGRSNANKRSKGRPSRPPGSVDDPAPQTTKKRAK